MMINSKFKSNKLSCVEKRMNYFVATFLVLLIILSLICLIGLLMHTNLYEKHWYLRRRVPLHIENNSSLFYFISFISFMNLNYIIPISLYITLELIRLLGSKFFEWDVEYGINFKKSKNIKKFFFL